MTETCFYCHREIAANDDEIVHGAKVVAHRACVHRELDAHCPDWREHEVSGAKNRSGRPRNNIGNGKKKVRRSSKPKRRLVGPTTTKRADPIFGLSSKAFR